MLMYEKVETPSTRVVAMRGRVRVDLKFKELCYEIRRECTTLSEENPKSGLQPWEDLPYFIFRVYRIDEVGEHLLGSSELVDVSTVHLLPSFSVILKVDDDTGFELCRSDVARLNGPLDGNYLNGQVITMGYFDETPMMAFKQLTQ